MTIVYKVSIDRRQNSSYIGSLFSGKKTDNLEVLDIYIYIHKIHMYVHECLYAYFLLGGSYSDIAIDLHYLDQQIPT